MKITKGLYAMGTSILFVMLGIYLVTTKSVDTETSFPLLTKVVGYACILLFGTILAMSFYRLIFKK